MSSSISTHPYPLPYLHGCDILHLVAFIPVPSFCFFLPSVSFSYFPFELYSLFPTLTLSNPFNSFILKNSTRETKEGCAFEVVQQLLNFGTQTTTGLKISGFFKIAAQDSLKFYHSHMVSAISTAVNVYWSSYT